MRTHNNKIDKIKKYNFAHLVTALDIFKWHIGMEVVRLALIICIIIIIVTIQYVSVLYNMFIYIIIIYCQNSCWEKSLCRHIGPIAGSLHLQRRAHLTNRDSILHDQLGRNWVY